MKFVILTVLAALMANANPPILKSLELQQGKIEPINSKTLKVEDEHQFKTFILKPKNDPKGINPKSATDLKKARAGGGGVDGGGGGNVRPSKPFLKSDLENFLNLSSARIALKLLFNDAVNFRGKALFKTDPEEFYCSDTPTCMEDYIKRHNLFLSLNEKLMYQDPEYTIFNSIKSARFYVQDEPCLDPITKQEMDAAAYVHNKSICFSYNRLKEKISRADLEDRIFMLLIHEITHLHFATEEEALAVETELGEWSSFHQLTNDMSTVSSRYGHNIAKTWITINEILNNFDKLTNTHLCTRLASAYRRLNELSISGDEILGQNSMSFHSVQELFENIGLGQRGLNLVVYCQGTKVSSIIDEIREDFTEWYDDNVEAFNLRMNAFPIGSKLQYMTMKQYFERIFPEQSNDFNEYPINGIVYNTRYRENVKKELMLAKEELQVEQKHFQEIFGYDPIKSYLDSISRFRENK